VPEVVAVPLFADVSLGSILLDVLVILLSLLLMFIVLIQRGKGGGLAGAFGGVGGSSPFGSRAGDAFTKITLYMAAVWVLVIMIHVKVAQNDSRAGTGPVIKSQQ
jgi:preprotein translocase subunit SecG